MQQILDYIESLSETAVFNVVIISCMIAALFILIRISNRSEKDFEIWLSENATKTEEGHYLYRHDKHDRLYSRKELMDFFVHRENINQG